MSLTITLPTGAELEALLEQLSGKRCLVAPACAGPFPSDAFASVYIDRRGVPRIVSICDRELALGLGAALAMMPAVAAREALESGDLPSGMKDGLRETMNISGALLCVEGGPNVRLEALYPSLSEAGEGALAICRDPADRVDYQVELTGYEGGGFRFLRA